MSNKVGFKKLHEEAMVPKRQTQLSSGFDLYCFDAVTTAQLKNTYNEDFKLIELQPGERVLVRTAIALQMTDGMEAQVRPRSGLALKQGITVLNTPGTIDADYTGDVGVILINLGQEPTIIQKGDRVAQLVFQAVRHDIELVELTELTTTERGAGGFGHTGVKGDNS
ncbi:dUTP diphosphatase [Heliorestis convoluta]|uniref:dUTP diphosphatase n=1 Tax=Heliorestis convoluta TaxID=356322 RepID=A0A5Q2MYF8_9FIRM|nr:dUTP diphosphatase [Heliorestis convoluta]QGG47677.1 dUTP diphosphatase family protein [Heliorestis convoluta]